MVEATLVAGALMALGYALERTAGDDWGLTGYIPGLVVAGVSTVAAGILYLPVVSARIIPGIKPYCRSPSQPSPPRSTCSRAQSTPGRSTGSTRPA